MLVWFFFVFYASLLHAKLQITEVFANAFGNLGDDGKEWVEIYNPGPESVDLTDLSIKRLDGPEKTLAFTLPLVIENQTLWIEPNQYIVLAQKADLGLSQCIHATVLTLSDSRFTLKNQGYQTLCLELNKQEEHCVLFSDKKQFPEGRSRYFEKDNFQTENCALREDFFATPGLPPRMCESNPAQFKEHLFNCPAPQEEPVWVFPDDFYFEYRDNLEYNVQKGKTACINIEEFYLNQEKNYILKQEINDHKKHQFNIEKPHFLDISTQTCVAVHSCYSPVPLIQCKTSLSPHVPFFKIKHITHQGKRLVIDLETSSFLSGNISIYLHSSNHTPIPLIAGISLKTPIELEITENLKDTQIGVKLEGPAGVFTDEYTLF